MRQGIDGKEVLVAIIINTSKLRCAIIAKNAHHYLGIRADRAIEPCTIIENQFQVSLEIFQIRILALFDSTGHSGQVHRIRYYPRVTGSDRIRHLTQRYATK